MLQLSGLSAVVSASDLKTGCCGHTPPPEAPGCSLVSLTASLVGSLLLSPGSQCAQCCVCALLECFPILWKFCSQIPLSLKVRFPEGSRSFCWISRLGNLLWALELSQQCENFFCIILLQSLGHLLSGFMVEIMATSSKRFYATHCATEVCCSQSSCPCGKPLRPHVSPQEILRCSKAGLA